MMYVNEALISQLNEEKVRTKTYLLLDGATAYEVVDEDIKQQDCDNISDSSVTRYIPIERVFNIDNNGETETHSLDSDIKSIVDCGTGVFKLNVTTSSEGLINIRHFYSSAFKDIDISNVNLHGITLKDISSMKSGYGWRFTYTISLTMRYEHDNGETYKVYAFVDKEGDLYRLYPSSNPGVYTDIYGMGVKLYTDEKGKVEYISVGSLRYYYGLGNGNGAYSWHIFDTSVGDTIEEWPKTRVELDPCKKMRIAKIIDCNENVITMEYEENRLVNINSSSGEQVGFEYSEDLLAKITYSDEKSIVFEYDSENRMTDIVLNKADGTCSRLQYRYCDEEIVEVTKYNGVFKESE